MLNQRGMADSIITSAEVANKLINMTEDNKQQSENVTNQDVVQEALKQVAKPVNPNAYDLVNKEGKKLSRKFLGNIFGRGAEKKEFEAYLKGRPTYSYKEKNNVAVRQEYFYV